MAEIPGKPNPLTHWLPHSAVAPANPLFAYAMRKVKWWHSWESPLLYGAYIVAWTVGTLVFIGANGLVNMMLTTLWPGFGYSAGELQFITEEHSTVVLWAFLGSVFAALFLDYVVLGRTLHSLISRRTSELGDLLHMTNMTGAQVVAAQHAIARVRVWRLTLLLFGWRLAALTLIAANTFWVEPLVAVRSPSADFIVLSPSAYGSRTAQILFGGLVLTFLTLEVLWRVRMVTALGVTLATRFRSLSAAFAGGGTILALAVTAPQVLLAVPVYSALASITLVSPFPYFGVLATAIMAVIIYFAYFSLENVALRRAQRYVFREGRE